VVKNGWEPTARTLTRFLAWLDEGVDSGGEKYLEMRRRLVWYFQRKRCLRSDELADETLNRVARRLEEEGTITDAPPAQYCYIVARYVFLESLRLPEPSASTIAATHADQFVWSSSARHDADDDDKRERLLECLDRCLAQLESHERALILEYYQGDQRRKIEHRRALAARLRVTANALSIKACRIRNRLEACVSACAAGT
jgi:DNA-directed RNA polymerase specialized sigma24 family protein